jgi:hypothetical protein
VTADPVEQRKIILAKYEQLRSERLAKLVELGILEPAPPPGGRPA